MLRKKLKHPTRVVYKRVMFARVKYLSRPHGDGCAVPYTTNRTAGCAHNCSAGDKEYRWTKYAWLPKLASSLKLSVRIKQT